MSVITTMSHFSKLAVLKSKPQDLPHSIHIWSILLVLNTGLFLLFNQNPETKNFLVTIYCVQNLAFLFTLYYIIVLAVFYY